MSDKDLSVTTTANPETMADNTCIYNNNFYYTKIHENQTWSRIKTKESTNLKIHKQYSIEHV